MSASDSPLSNEILLEHAAWVRRVARELVRDPELADDLAQDTWLAFLRARPDPTRPLRPWLRATLRNAVSLGFRCHSARTWREAQVARSDALPASDAPLLRSEEQHRLTHLVLGLAEPYRTALLLRYSEGHSPTEIARLQGIPDSTVRSHIRRGLASLRESLDAEHGGDRRAWVLIFGSWAQPAGTAASLSLAGWATLLVAVPLAIWGLWSWAGQVDGPGSNDGAPHQDRVVADAEPPVNLLAPAAVGDSHRLPAARPARAEARAGERVVNLVDERNARPLPYFRVQAGTFLGTTDSAGRVTVPAEATHIIPIDDPELAVRTPISHNRSVDRPASRKPLRIPADGVLTLPVGPVFLLEFPIGVPTELDALRITLAGTGHTAPGQALQVAPVRAPRGAFETHWARFAEMPSGASDERVAWRLEARDRAGWLFGTTPVKGIIGPEPLLVSLEVAATGALSGVIRPVAVDRQSRTSVILTQKRGGNDHVVGGVVELDGTYRIRWIQPGTYRLQVASAQHANWTQVVEVHARETTVTDVSLEALPAKDIAGGSVAGIIRSESGAYTGQLLVFLLDAQGTTIAIDATSWKAAGSDRGLEAYFSFETVPTGALSLEIVSLAGLVPATGDMGPFHGPKEDCDILLRDDRPVGDWHIKVLDEVTGTAVLGFDLDVRMEGGFSRSFRRDPSSGLESRWTLMAGGVGWNTFEGPTALRELPADAVFTWTVRTPGCAPVDGDESAFETGPSGQRIALIRVSGG